MIEGGGSRNYIETKKLMYAIPLHGAVFWISWLRC